MFWLLEDLLACINILPLICWWMHMWSTTWMFECWLIAWRWVVAAWFSCSFFVFEYHYLITCAWIALNAKNAIVFMSKLDNKQYKTPWKNSPSHKHQLSLDLLIQFRDRPRTYPPPKHISFLLLIKDWIFVFKKNKIFF